MDLHNSPSLSAGGALLPQAGTCATIAFTLSSAAPTNSTSAPLILSPQSAILFLSIAGSVHIIIYRLKHIHVLEAIC